MIVGVPLEPGVGLRMVAMIAPTGRVTVLATP